MKRPLAQDRRFGADLGIQLLRNDDLGPIWGVADIKNQRLGPIWGLQLRRKNDFGPIWGVRLRSAGDKVIPGARAEGQKCPGANPPSLFAVF